MDWVDKLSVNTFTPLPETPPKYWEHRLVRHLGLPDEWPVDWQSESIQAKAFTLFLEFFDPPANLQGLQHQLMPLEFIIKSSAEAVSITTAYKAQLEGFFEQVHDYIATAEREERALLSANKLGDITNLGIWRFHFHCSQVVREKINAALDISPESEDGDSPSKVIRVARLEYLRDGSLDKVYRSIACELHQFLRRRRLLKLALPKKTDKENSRLNDIIYAESLAAEHCLHLAHHLLRNKSSDQERSQCHDLKDILRQLSDKETVEIELAAYDPKIRGLVKKILSNIRTVHRLLAMFGGLDTRNLGKRRNFTTREGARDGRLLPPGRYEQTEEECEDPWPTPIESPLNIIHGTSEDDSSEGLFRRKYGRRPKVSHNLGESDEDYLEGNLISIPASWLVDPYRNAIKQQVQAEGLITATEPPAWSISCLMVSTIRQYIHNASTLQPDTHLLSLVALHTGLQESRIKEFRIGRPPLFDLLEQPDQIPEEDYATLMQEIDDKWKDIYLDPETFSYAYVLPRKQAAYYDEKGPDFIAGCQPASRIIRIPLPPVAIHPLRTWLGVLREKHGKLASPRPDDSRAYRKLFRRWERVSGEWAELMAETGKQCNENITPSRIRATFRSLYVGQMNLAPLHANLISAEIPMHYRAQHFYANISYSNLQNEYMRISESIVKVLSGDLKEKVPETNRIFLEDEQLRFGSRLVPERERLASYFSELHTSFATEIQQKEMFTHAWNRMTLYLLRLLQLTTGIRPARDALPAWSDISFKLNWIRISDKDNLHYFESRTIPMASRLNQWLKHLGSLQLDYFIGMNLRPHGLANPYRDRPTQSIFVFMDSEKKIIRPFTFDDIKLIEESTQLTNGFNYKANALRHHLLSRLHESGLDQAVIDFIMGHKHFGREPFGRFSPISTPKYSHLAIQHLDQHITEPLGILEPETSA